MIRWLLLGLLLLFSESACGRDGNAIVSEDEKEGTTRAKAAAAAAVEANIKAASASSTDHEDVYRLTCYTCVNVSDNKMCNEWAIDTPCPASGRDFCRSLHIVDSRGQSVLVNKSCASRVECSPASVGCMPIDTQKICISCCDTSYCNVDSPTNSSNATYSRKRPWPSKTKSQAERDSEHDSEANTASNVCPSHLQLFLVALTSLHSVVVGR